MKMIAGIFTLFLFTVFAAGCGPGLLTSGSQQDNNQTLSCKTTSNVTLTWDHPGSTADATLAGFKLHYGPSSGNYTDSTDVGLSNPYTVVGLTPGQTYFFVVTAYDTNNLESGYSNEVCVIASMTRKFTLQVKDKRAPWTF